MQPTSAFHHSPGEYAQGLIDEWSRQSWVNSLPGHVQAALSAQAGHRALRLMGALLEDADEDTTPITRGKATAPGDDGITYSVLRQLQKVPGNPLLHLDHLRYRLGHVPTASTCSTIVSIPKPGTDKFRPASLTSCFSKVME